MRTDVRKPTIGLIVLAAAATLAGLAGCRADSGALAGSSPSAAPATSGASPAVPPSQSAPSRPAPPPTTPGSTAAGVRCGPSNLTLSPVEGDGAMGQQGYKVTVTNHGTAACGIPAYPSLVYTDASGKSHPLPTTKRPPSHTLTLLQPNGEAVFMLLAANAYAGYDPSDAVCASPATYSNLAIQFDSGPLAVPGLSLNVLCGDITLVGWSKP